MPGGVFPLQPTANACKHSYTVASVVFFSRSLPPMFPRNTHINRTGTIHWWHFSNASCTTHRPTVLYTMHLLPPRRELSYNIRQRHHDRQLNIISGQLRSRNFIYRMLHVQGLLLTVFIFSMYCVTCTCADAFCHFCLINEYDDDDDEAGLLSTSCPEKSLQYFRHNVSK